MVAIDLLARRRHDSGFHREVGQVGAAFAAARISLCASAAGIERLGSEFGAEPFLAVLLMLWSRRTLAVFERGQLQVPYTTCPFKLVR